MKYKDLMQSAVQKMAEPIEMPFEMLIEAQGRMYYTGSCPICTRAILRGKWQPVVKYRDILRSSAVSCAKWLNRSRCHLVYGFGLAEESMR